MSKLCVSLCITSIVLFLGCSNAKTFLVKAKGQNVSDKGKNHVLVDNAEKNGSEPVREYGEDYKDDGGNVTGDYHYWNNPHWGNGKWWHYGRCQPYWNGYQWVYSNKWWCHGGGSWAGEGSWAVEGQLFSAIPFNSLNPGALITGGNDRRGRTRRDVEVYNPVNQRTCKITDLPSGPLKSILCGDLLCGINTCMRWNSVTYKFEKTSVNLQKRRDNHLCWAIDNGVLLLGGTTSSKTTELVVGDGSSSVSRFDLIYPARYSCGIDREDGTYVITGGEKEERRATVYTTTGFRNVLPDLQVGRYQHSCSKFTTEDGQMAMIVTGGWTDKNRQRLTYTEMYIDGAVSWSAIPAYLPIKIKDAAAVTLSNHVYLFGGWDGSRQQTQILKLTSSGGTYRWEGAGVMKVGRSTHTVGVIEDVSRICP